MITTSPPRTRPSTPSRTRWRALAACVLGLLSVAANCEQCQQLSDPRRGNLDRAADAVLVTKDDGHTYAILASPELQHLRVFDATAASFVEAPNGYFPLSIPVGPDTRDLAVAVPRATADGEERAAVDESRVFALDHAADLVFVVDTARFTISGEPVATGRAPGALAVVGAGDDIELWVTLPDESAVEVYALGDAEAVARIELPALGETAAAPLDIVVDPLGESVVVGDAAQPRVHVLSVATRALDRSLDVGGTVGALSAGVVDLGDGLAPVVLALLRDRPVASLVRLFRPGVPEERYEVMGSAELPALPLTAYVPDHRVTATVCCRELSDEAIEAGEATDAWAAVATADGKLVYLSLGAVDGLVRLLDDDLEGLSLGEDIADAWQPEAGDEDREPVPTFEADLSFGDPPFVPFVAVDEQITLVWEGGLPGLTRVRGSWEGADSAFRANANLEERGAAVGDLAVIAAEEPAVDCPAEVQGAVVTVAGSLVGVDLAPDDVDCIDAGVGQLRITIAPDDAFVATDRAGDFLGRLAFGEELLLPGGAALSLAEAAAGAPQQRGSTLVVPVDPHLDIVDLDLSDAVGSFLTNTGGGRGEGAFLPVAIVGREMDVPGRELGTLITARQMIIVTASSFHNGFVASRLAASRGNGDGLQELYVCDEAETVPALCRPFR